MAAEYPGTIVVDRKAVIDTMLVTLAPPDIELAASTARQRTVRRIAPSTLRSSAAENPSGSHSSLPSGKLAPALFTRTSSDEMLPAKPVDGLGVAHVELVVGEAVERGVVVGGRRTGPGDGDRRTGVGERGSGREADPAGPTGHEDIGADEVETAPVGHHSTPIVIITLPQSLEPSSRLKSLVELLEWELVGDQRRRGRDARAARWRPRTGAGTRSSHGS